MRSIKPIAIPRHLIFFILLAAMAAAANIGAFRSAVRLPLNLDEVEEATLGWKFSRIGPRTFLSVPGGGEQISHPLLYTFTHAAVQRLFGPGELPLRLYGVFHYVLGLVLVAGIARRLIGIDGPARRIGVAVSAVLYAVNPLLVQHSVVVNADNNILTTMILLFVYWYAVFETKPAASSGAAIKRTLALGALFAGCLWAKELAPFFLAFGLVVYRVLDGDAAKLARDLFGVFIVGTALFWATWWLYCAATGTDVWAFVKFTLIDKSRIALSPRYTGQLSKIFFKTFRWPVYWVSAPFFAALAVWAAARIRFFIRRKKLALIDGIGIAALCMWTPFQFFKPNIDMMKYQYPAYPLFFLVIGWMVSRLLARHDRAETVFFDDRWSCIMIPLWALMTYHYYRIGDYLLAVWEPLHKHLNGHFMVYYYAPLVFAVAFAAFVSSRRARFANAVLALVFLIIPVNAALLANQARADYITAEVWRNYGERGFRETLAYLRERVRPGSVAAVRKDLYYYLRADESSRPARQVPLPRLFGATDTRVFRLLLSDPALEYLVFDQVWSPQYLGEEKMRIILGMFVFEKQIGSFYVFKKQA